MNQPKSTKLDNAHGQLILIIVLWLRYNLLAIGASIALVAVDYFTSDGNIETWTMTNEIVSMAGLLMPIVSVFVVNPVILIVKACRKTFRWKELGINLCGILVHLGVAAWFIVSFMGRAFF